MQWSYFYVFKFFLVTKWIRILLIKTNILVVPAASGSYGKPRINILARLSGRLAWPQHPALSGGCPLLPPWDPIVPDGLHQSRCPDPKTMTRCFPPQPPNMPGGPPAGAWGGRGRGLGCVNLQWLLPRWPRGAAARRSPSSSWFTTPCSHSPRSLTLGRAPHEQADAERVPPPASLPSNGPSGPEDPAAQSAGT